MTRDGVIYFIILYIFSALATRLKYAQYIYRNYDAIKFAEKQKTKNQKTNDYESTTSRLCPYQLRAEYQWNSTYNIVIAVWQIA